MRGLVWLAVLGSLGCQEDVTAVDAAIPAPAVEPLPEMRPPPIYLSATELYVGMPGEVTATGATPGARVDFAISLTGPGPGPCPPPLGGACLQLLDPVHVGYAIADATGEATKTFTVPTVVPIDTTVWVQAAQVLGGSTDLSPVLWTRVLDPACPETIADFWAETGAIRSCSFDWECGQVLSGTSCGCTRDWVARNDADPAQFYDLLTEAGACGLTLFSTCDCPAVSGFACDGGFCNWDYI